MNNRSTKCAAFVVFLVAILTVPVRAAADSWKHRHIDIYDYRHDHHDRDDHARWKQRDWREDQRDWREDQRDWREDQRDWREDQREARHDHHRYSDLAPSRKYGGYNSYYSDGVPYAAVNSGNYLQSGAATVRNQLVTGYANLQTAYANALAAGDSNGAKHYLNALKQQQKEIAQYNTTWGSTAGTISTSALPANNYFANYPVYGNNAIYPNLFQNAGVGLTPYNAAQIDPRLGAATALLLMGGQMIHP